MILSVAVTTKRTAMPALLNVPVSRSIQRAPAKKCRNRISTGRYILPDLEISCNIAIQPTIPVANVLYRCYFDTQEPIQIQLLADGFHPCFSTGLGQFIYGYN